MIATAVDAVIEEYLRQLDHVLVPLPGPRRAQLVAEIADHIAAAREQLDNPSEADIRNLLDRIGRPEDIAAEPANDADSAVEATTAVQAEPEPDTAVTEPASAAASTDHSPPDA